MNSLAQRAAMFLTVLFCAAGVAACTSTEEELCEAQVQCESPGGNQEQEIEICLIRTEASEEVAAEKGCDGVYEQALDCYLEHAGCVSGKYNRSDACEDVTNLYTECLAGSTGF